PCRSVEWDRAQEGIGGLSNLPAMHQQLPAISTQLTPEGSGTNPCQQQGADLMGNALLLQVVVVTGNLDAETEGADGFGIKSANIGDHIVMCGGKMLCLLSRLLQAAANHSEHILATVELLLQMQDAQTVAQCVSVFVLLAETGLLQNIAQDSQAKMQIGEIITVYGERVLRIQYKQALNTALVGVGGHIAGFCQLLHEPRRLKQPGEGDAEVIPILTHERLFHSQEIVQGRR